MKEFNCIECRCLVAKLSSGSSIKKDTVFYCSDCDNSKIEYPESSDGMFNDSLQSLKDLFGMK